jgi:hypothetical protein
MPAGKPAGVRCVQLDDDNRCRIYGLPERPAVCSRLRAQVEMCGATRQEALEYLTGLERTTSPSAPSAPDAPGAVGASATLGAPAAMGAPGPPAPLATAGGHAG